MDAVPCHDVPDLHDLYGAAFEAPTRTTRRSVEAGELHGERIPAIELWKQMLRMLFETGHPWITFKDPCNVRSPQDHAGVIHSSNLCTEITLNTGRTRPPSATSARSSPTGTSRPTARSTTRSCARRSASRCARSTT